MRLRLLCPAPLLYIHQQSSAWCQAPLVCRLVRMVEPAIHVTGKRGLPAGRCSDEAQNRM